MTTQFNLDERHIFPCYESFSGFIDGICAEHADKPALSWFTRKQEMFTYTYAELRERVIAFRAALCTLDIPNARIAIAAENSAEWIVTFLAAATCSCTVACIDVEQSDERIREMIRDVQADILFVSSQYLPICSQLLQEQAVQHIALFGDSETDGDDTISWNSLYEQGRKLTLSGNVPTPAAKSDIAELIFTSGTDGKAKIVMLSESAILKNVQGASNSVYLNTSVYSSLPFYHAYGLNIAVFCPLLEGAHLYINGDIRSALRDLWLSGAETMFAVPLIVKAVQSQIWQKLEADNNAELIDRLCKSGPARKKFLRTIRKNQLSEIGKATVGNLKLIVSGGASLDSDIAEDFELLGVKVLQGYGITECSPLIAVNCSYANKPGTVGLPLDSAELRIENDEIWVKGPCVMLGYYNDPEQTAAAFEDGWFKTGDLGHFDKDGFLVLTGRKKNLIVFSNGKKISPEMLERLIIRIPLVKEVVVYGSASGTASDDVKITANIFPDPEKSAGMASYELLNRIQEDIEKINETLPAYQQIQMITLREKEFPKTSIRKVMRQQLQ